jgi:hypothetical protein
MKLVNASLAAAENGDFTNATGRNLDPNAIMDRGDWATRCGEGGWPGV